MSLKPLNQVLTSFDSQRQRQEQGHFQKLLRGWVDVVGPVVATQTQPLAIHRGVLKVATSSPAWAQNLVFERQRIMDKLNQLLSLDIVDIRFSTAQWHSTPVVASFPGEEQQTQLWQQHPSRLTHQAAPSRNLLQQLPEKENFLDPLTAFKKWELMVRSRSHQLPLCPECKCPTPEGELKRWQVCAICAPKQW